MVMPDDATKSQEVENGERRYQIGSLERTCQTSADPLNGDYRHSETSEGGGFTMKDTKMEFDVLTDNQMDGQSNCNES